MSEIGWATHHFPQWDTERNDWLITIICRCRVRHQVAFGELPLRCKCGRVWNRELTGA